MGFGRNNKQLPLATGGQTDILTGMERIEINPAVCNGRPGFRTFQETSADLQNAAKW